MLKQKLKLLNLKGEIADDQQTLDAYSHDASLFEVKPEIVIYPDGVEDIKKIVKFVAEQKKAGNKISITARSAGTDMSGGPLNDSIILDFTKHFNHIIEVGDDYGIVEPGVFYRDFEHETMKKDLLLASYPASRELCAIGGIVSNNSGGEKTLTYGKTEDYVEELHMVWEDGEEHVIKALNEKELQAKMAEQTFEGQVYRQIYELLEKNYDSVEAAKPNVHKNSAGYYLWNVWDKKTGVFNLNKLLVGSQGTLGIVTKVKFRLIHPKHHSEMLVILMKNMSNLAELVDTVLQFKPESFESYDDKTLELAMKYLPELIRIMKPTNIFSLGWQFIPEAWMVLTGGFPKLILMAEFTGDDLTEIHQRASAAQKAIQKFGWKSRIASEMESKKYWTIRRESFNLLRKHMRGLRTAPFIDDIVVRPEYLPEFLPKLNAILAQYDLVYTIAGHAGDGNFHIIPLMDFKLEKTREIIPKLSDEVYSLVLAYHGSITGEHNDGLIRSPYLQKMYGPKIYGLFEQTKKIFDQENIFNPGKKVNSDLTYSMDHMVKTS